MVKICARAERGAGLKFALKTFQTVKSFTAHTPIKYGPNQKTKGSKSWDRYESYRKARTVGESLSFGAKLADLLWELDRGMYEVLPESKRPLKLKISAKEAEQWNERLKSFIGPRGLALNLDDDRANEELEREEAWRRGKIALIEEQAIRLGLKLETETRDELTEDGVYETADIRNGRLVAEAIAEERLQKGTVTNEDVTLVLRTWGFAQNVGRVNVLPQGRKWVYSDTMGAIKHRTGTYGVTPPTVRYPHVAKCLNMWVQNNLPKGVDSFPCTSININANYAGKRHRDGNNEGPSLIRAFGEFAGGELRYWPEDTGLRSKALDCLSHSDAHVFNIMKETVLFDGRKAHEVDPFCGERISVVFFSCRNFNKVGSKNIAFLKKSAGFVWPTGSNSQRMKC